MGGRMVDLTRVIEPTGPEAERKFVVHIHDALEEIPGKQHPPGEWYVMSDGILRDGASGLARRAGRQADGRGLGRGRAGAR
jgi:hypothetical protein